MSEAIIFGKRHISMSIESTSNCGSNVPLLGRPMVAFVIHLILSFSFTWFVSFLVRVATPFHGVLAPRRAHSPAHRVIVVNAFVAREEIIWQERELRKSCTHTLPEFLEIHSLTVTTLHAADVAKLCSTSACHVTATV